MLSGLALLRLHSPNKPVPLPRECHAGSEEAVALELRLLRLARLLEVLARPHQSLMDTPMALILHVHPAVGKLQAPLHLHVTMLI